MTLHEAQDVAERWANFHSEKVTLGEIKGALVCLANWYEDNRRLSEKQATICDKVEQAINLLKGSTWQSMNDKLIVQRVIEILEGKRAIVRKGV